MCDPCPFCTIGINSTRSYTVIRLLMRNYRTTTRAIRDCNNYYNYATNSKNNNDKGYVQHQFNQQSTNNYM